MLDNSCIGPSRNVPDDMATSGEGSMNVSSGCSADEFHLNDWVPVPMNISAPPCHVM